MEEVKNGTLSLTSGGERKKELQEEKTDNVFNSREYTCNKFSRDLAICCINMFINDLITYLSTLMETFGIEN